RINEPADIGRIAAFLLSDAAAGIAGADLVADNGMSALLFNRTRSST
ncbi:TPA: SDR family oxidoreductase, partial [Burkholderia stabilis]|nr:SDR family oxidoreductase [Burkholderia stabilis]